MVDKIVDLERIALDFLVEAFKVLTQENVLPCSATQRYLRVGRDFFGESLRNLPEFTKLEASLLESFPDRFSKKKNPEELELPSLYVFSLLSAAIFENGRTPMATINAPVSFQGCVSELVRVLSSSDVEVICCREVSYLTTKDGRELSIGNITVIPGSGSLSHQQLLTVADDLIPGAIGAFGSELPSNLMSPKSLIVARLTTSRASEEVRAELQLRIERFLRLLHLYQSSATQSLWQVTGVSTLVSYSSPDQITYHDNIAFTFVSRNVALGLEDVSGIQALGAMLDQATIVPKEVLATSFEFALIRFVRSFEKGDLFDQVVDLATAMEAVINGNDTENDSITARLRGRVSALIATDSDTASMIYADIGHLYKLRSALVHGGTLKKSRLDKIISSLSTYQPSEAGRTAMARAVDRMRDLVRRSLLARLALAEGPNPPWPLDGNTDVDLILAEPSTREVWSKAWRELLEANGAGKSVAEASPAQSYLPAQAKGKA